jgi:preprotein translocase subunit SecB
MLTSVNPDVLILWRQRIYDYTQQGAQENALDPVSFQDMYQFYMDASQDKLKGYHLVYQNSIGLMFVSNTLYQIFFQ